MVTKFGHHVSIMYGPQLDDRERINLESELNDVIQRWRSLRLCGVDPTSRIRALLRLPTHAYIRRDADSAYEQHEQIHLGNWRHDDVVEALQRGLLLPKGATDGLEDDERLVDGLLNKWS